MSLKPFWSNYVSTFFLFFVELVLLLHLVPTSRKCFLHLIVMLFIFFHLQCKMYYGGTCDFIVVPNKISNRICHLCVRGDDFRVFFKNYNVVFIFD